MATLNGFVRPSDPINATDLAQAIKDALGKNVTVEITPIVTVIGWGIAA